MKDVLIRWKTKGSFIVEGRGHARKPGDQDVMSLREVKPLMVCGMVEIIGDVNSVAAVESVTQEEENEN